jgi:hypothetical protein
MRYKWYLIQLFTLYRISHCILFQLMVYGLRGHLGERVLCHVVEELTIGLDLVLTQHHNMVDHNAREHLQQLNNVIRNLVSVSIHHFVILQFI